MSKKDQNDQRPDGSEQEASQAQEHELDAAARDYGHPGQGDSPTDSSDVPDWLRREDASADIDALIEKAEESMALTEAQSRAAFDELASWSSAYDGNPERELAGLTRLREHLKTLPKAQLKPGQFAAVKQRIAKLEEMLGLR